MMTILRSRNIPLFAMLLVTFLYGMCSLSAQSESGVIKKSIGRLKVSLIFGTNGDVNLAGKNLKKMSGDQLKEIKFENYRLMGEDIQPILKRYVNWANPIKGSKQILVSFQPGGKPMGGYIENGSRAVAISKEGNEKWGQLKKGEASLYSRSCLARR